MFLKHPCNTKWSTTARLLFGTDSTVYAMRSHTCAAYLLVVSRLPKRELRSKSKGSSFMLWLKLVIIVFLDLLNLGTVEFGLCELSRLLKYICFYEKKGCVGWRWSGQRSLDRQCPFCWCVCLWGSGWAGWG